MRSTMSIRVFSLFLSLLLFSSPFLQVARCQSDPETEVVEGTGEAGDLGIVGDDVQDFGSDNFSPAPGIETVCVFPKNPSKVVAAGEESEVLVGMKNDGDSSLNVIAIQASVHLPFDHRYLVQNLSVKVSSLLIQLKFHALACSKPIVKQVVVIGLLTFLVLANGLFVYVFKLGVKTNNYAPPPPPPQVEKHGVKAFDNATVPPSAQATFPYIFAVSKFMQPGSFDLVGTIVYEVDQNPYQSTFYNGTIEVTEPCGLLSVESVFLFCLGIAVIGLLGLWIRGQIQNLSKKTKRAPKAKVEVGTATTVASTDEWLEGTAYTQTLSNKSKKKK
ncbi:Translocon-associated protein subunit alpha [Capsicum annuum]|nr:Translocon-associated protein subunit alpha [Capsicum annuum]